MVPPSPTTPSRRPAFPQTDYRYIVAGALFALSIVLLVLPGSLVWIPASLTGLSAVLIVLPKWLHRTTAQSVRNDPPTETQLLEQSEKQVEQQVATVEMSVLRATYVRERRAAFETMIDQVLDQFIGLIRSKVTCCTIAVFFPTTHGAYALRRFHSEAADVDPHAAIEPGVGLIGSLLKEGLKDFNLREIPRDSSTLLYYSGNVAIKSLAVVPIVADGTKRGVIVVDHAQENHFTDSDCSFLKLVGMTCGEAIFHAYLSNEHKLQHVRMAAMSNSDKHFFELLDVRSILEKLFEFVGLAIPSTRISVSMRKDDPREAVICFVQGPDASALQDLEFKTAEKSIMGLLFQRNMCFFRNLSDTGYEIRYTENEPRCKLLRSFIAFPVGVEEVKGAILLESDEPDAFSDATRVLLTRMATSAGLAIEKVQLLEQARNLATHDGLTGLNNHRQFQKLLRDQITRCNRYSESLSLLLCDIDYFKKINDTHGHPFGDNVLRQIAELLQTSIRDGIDIASRYGGEEFAILLVKTDLDYAVESAERIRANLHRKVFRSPRGDSLTVTMSFGIATWLLHARDIDSLIKKADKALYRAKERGRDRVEVALN